MSFHIAKVEVPELIKPVLVRVEAPKKELSEED
jgi:hypothetical protein